MKVSNETDYDGSYLRRLFMACEKEAVFWKYSKPGDKKRRQVIVKYAKGRGMRGTARYSSYTIVMRLNRDNTKFKAHTIAQIYIHEIEHNTGARHRDMADCFNRKVTFWPDEIIPLKVKKEKPKIDLSTKREMKARRYLKQWETKLKRAKTAVKKYSKTVVYYEKKAAIKAATKKE